MKKLNILVFSGAGISAESGIPTFRSSQDALWNNHKIEEVASIEAWQNNPQLVLDFYNSEGSVMTDPIFECSFILTLSNYR